MFLSHHTALHLDLLNFKALFHFNGSAICVSKFIDFFDGSEVHCTLVSASTKHFLNAEIAFSQRQEGTKLPSQLKSLLRTQMGLSDWSKQNG